MKKILLILLVITCVASCTQRKKTSSKEKVLNASLGADIKGFDPVFSTDVFTHIALSQVYEGLLEYHYLKRPYELKPLLAKEMPTFSKDGLTVTFKLRDDAYFHEDPAFGGKPRKVKSSDVMFSYKRIADPHVKSPNWWIFEDRIQGLDEFRTKLQKLKSQINYEDHPVNGLQAPDDQTFVIKLNRPYRQLLYVLAMAPTMIVAPEVVKKYGDELLNHPVGTGPFVLKNWTRGQRLVFERNRKYRKSFYPKQGTKEDQKEGLLKANGKRLPFVDKMILWIYVESQPRWLNFLRGNLDFAGIPKEAYDSVYDEKGNVKEEIKKRKIVVGQTDNADVVFYAFNMEDPILGKNKYLRQAISAAFNRKEKIKLFYNNRAIVSHGPIPPGIFGYDETLRNPYLYDLEKAKSLMKKARELYHAQGGKGDIPPILYDITNSTVARQFAEAEVRDLEKIGLKVKLRVGTWPQFSERMAKKQTEFFAYAWHADYPDPENFLQLLYSKNVSPGPNHSNFKNVEYDRLFEKMRDMENTPERKAIILKMAKIVQEEVPWVLFNHRLAFPIRHTWVKNFKRNTFTPGAYKYLDIDLEEKSAALPLLK